VRVGLERPDSITESAISAREEIGRAVAEKIRGMEDARYMRRFAQFVLPRIGKFLESPEEKRLRRLRSGMITALIGIAIGVPAIAFISSVSDSDMKIFVAYAIVFGAITFATGLGLLVNGLLFSKPSKGIEDNSSEARMQSLIDSGYAPPKSGGEPGATHRSHTTSNLASTSGSSITEHTTQHLKTER